MSSSTGSTFSREKFVAALTDYYDFLRRAYIPDHLFKYPPENGWPELVNADLSFMGKDEVVLDTIRHMPYIEKTLANYDICYGCEALDYTSDEFQTYCIDRAARGEKDDQDLWNNIPGQEDTCRFPSDVFWIARTSRGAGGYLVAVDTTRDTVTLMGEQEGPEPTELSDDDAGERYGQSWREHATWKVEDFFEHLKDQFRSGSLVGAATLECFNSFMTDPMIVARGMGI